jgi:heavy metal sensor kinase
MKADLSISLRLTLWFTTIFVCGFVLFGGFIWWDLSASLSNGRDKTLTRRAERLSELFKNTENDSAVLIQAKYDDLVEATPEGQFIQVYSFDGRRLLPLASASAVSFPWPAVPPSAGAYFSDVWFEGQPYRVFADTAMRNRAPVRIFVAGQLTDNRQLLRRLSETLERSAPVLLLASALAGYFISRRALKPVVRLTESARCITIGNLAARLPVSPVNDELARLAEACNEMLSRLEQAVKSITQFTADASHELRSPISVIRMTCEYALRTPGLDAEATQALSSVVNEAEHCTHLLEDMLLLARSDAGRAQLAFEPVYLAEIVLEVVARMRVLAKNKLQSLVDFVPDQDLYVVGDSVLLRRLVWTLVDNAIKYTPCEGRIEVAFARNGQAAHLTVSDNGIGIPAALVPHIFDRFLRADPSRGEEDGTGLGLAIAKWIAEAHHATIVAHSVERTGTILEVVFPLGERSRVA